MFESIIKSDNNFEKGFFLLVVCIRRHQKHDSANYDRFAPNSYMSYKTIRHVSVPNLKLFRPMNIELWAKEVG